MYAGFDEHRQANNNDRRKLNWFKAFYGVEPEIIAAIFEEIRIIKKKAIAKVFLMTVNWLFLYDTYPVLSGRWKYSEDFIAENVIEYGLVMAKISGKKIVFELEHDVELGRTVDCCNFTIQEMRLDPNSKWYDHKSNSCGLVSCKIVSVLDECSIICI